MHVKHDVLPQSGFTGQVCRRASLSVDLRITQTALLVVVLSRSWIYLVLPAVCKREATFIMVKWCLLGCFLT